MGEMSREVRHITQNRLDGLRDAWRFQAGEIDAGGVLACIPAGVLRATLLYSIE
jgi:hypothetical protein